MWTSIRNVKFFKNALEYNVYHRCLCNFLNQTWECHIKGAGMNWEGGSVAEWLERRIANWSASRQLGFLTVYVIFELFVSIVCSAPLALVL